MGGLLTSRSANNSKKSEKNRKKCGEYCTFCRIDIVYFWKFPSPSHVIVFLDLHIVIACFLLFIHDGNLGFKTVKRASRPRWSPNLVKPRDFAGLSTLVDFKTRSFLNCIWLQERRKERTQRATYIIFFIAIIRHPAPTQWTSRAKFTSTSKKNQKIKYKQRNAWIKMAMIQRRDNLDKKDEAEHVSRYQTSKGTRN